MYLYTLTLLADQQFYYTLLGISHGKWPLRLITFNKYYKNVCSYYHICTIRCKVRTSLAAMYRTSV